MRMSGSTNSAAAKNENALPAKASGEPPRPTRAAPRAGPTMRPAWELTLVSELALVSALTGVTSGTRARYAG